MELSYEIHPLLVSLEKTCAAQLAYRVIYVVHERSGFEKWDMDAGISSEGAVEDLNLPPHLRELVEFFVHRIDGELRSWYATFPCRFLPILTPIGTVDLSRSTKKIAEDPSLNCSIRYVIASVFCHEEAIFMILSRSRNAVSLFGPNVERDPALSGFQRKFMRRSWRAIPKIWFDAYKGKYGELIDGRYLPQRFYDESLGTVVQYGADSTVKYFAGKASRGAVTCYMDTPSRFQNFLSKSAFCGPATCGVLFSKLTIVQQEISMRLFSRVLLRALLDWPYQPLFLQAARSLTKHLAVEEYWTLLDHTAQMDYEDTLEHDNQTLFTMFWDFGASHRGRVDAMENKCHQLAYYALTREEQDIPSFLLTMSMEQRELLLLEMERNRICLDLFSKGKLQELMEFIGICAMHDLDLLTEFRARFAVVYPRYLERGMPQNTKRLHTDWRTEFDAILNEVRVIVDALNKSSWNSENSAEELRLNCFLDLARATNSSSSTCDDNRNSVA